MAAAEGILESSGHREGEHCAQFYLDEAVLTDSLARWVRQGCESDAAVVLIASAAHLQRLEQHWQSDGNDASRARQAGRLMALDAEAMLAAFPPEEAPDRERFFAGVGRIIADAARRCGRVVAFSELAALLWKQGRPEAAVRLEQLFNELATRCSFTLLCVHSMRDCADARHIRPFEALCAAHNRIVPVDEELLSSPLQRQRVVAQLQQKELILQAKLAAESEALPATAHLAAIVDSSDDAIISKSLDGVIQSWNRGAERLFGYSAQETIGRSITIIIPSDRLDEEQHILDTLKRGERVDHIETKRRTKDGRLIDISLTVSPVRNGAGEVIGASKIARDITARKLSEQLLREREQALREIDRRKDEFLALLGHELRNPLAPIRNASELLSRTLPPESTARVGVDMISRQVEQLNRLVDELLDVGRITHGRIQLQLEPIELGSVIAQAVETVEPQLRHKQHRVAFTSSYEPLHVSGDFARLVQCVVNILGNAAKYTDAGGEIHIQTRAEGACAVIEITDTGTGIAPELLPRIFDLFVQSDQTLDRSQGGLGIGLSVVRRLIEMHGGEVCASSPGIGLGSTFQIRLARIPRPQRRAAQSAPLKAPPRRVLIVDDNADAAVSLAMLMGQDGHETQLALSGSEALQLVGSFRPDVALLDIGLPQMDGYELARQLRARSELQGIRLVALTGYGQAEDRQRSQIAGFDDHLVKPVDPLALERTLLSARGGLPPR